MPIPLEVILEIHVKRVVNVKRHKFAQVCKEPPRHLYNRKKVMHNFQLTSSSERCIQIFLRNILTKQISSNCLRLKIEIGFNYYSEIRNYRVTFTRMFGPSSFSWIRRNAMCGGRYPHATGSAGQRKWVSRYVNVTGQKPPGADITGDVGETTQRMHFKLYINS